MTTDPRFAQTVRPARRAAACPRPPVRITTAAQPAPPAALPSAERHRVCALLRAWTGPL